MSTTPSLTPSRLPNRSSQEATLIADILDEALFVTVAYVADGRPMQLPTAHVRVGDRLYLHGSVKSHFIQQLADGREACISASLMDGLVLARSAMHHSINYRSVVAFGGGQLVEESTKKDEVLHLFTEKLLPGRWADIRPPSPGELTATAVIEFPLTHASAKVRNGPPSDALADRSLPVWGGIVPLTTHQGVPVPDEHNQVPLPAYLTSAFVS